ncbi:MAG: GNAT family N-acetyltransferase [Marinilabiliales bacterium]|nr:GNAT family N-acetyltransferase [Marinilabiliales bacterium]
MEIRISPVTLPSEIREVARLGSEIWNEYYVSIIGQEQVDYMLDKFQSAKSVQTQIREEGYEYFLITRAGETLGYAAILEKSHEIFLSKLYLLSSERGKGIGKIFIGFLVAKAFADGFGYITLTVNKNNSGTIEAYQKMGFDIYGEVVNDIGEGFVMDDYLMLSAMMRGSN